MRKKIYQQLFVHKRKNVEFYNQPKFGFVEKRFYTRGTLTSKGFPNWLKFQPFFMVGWDPWSKKMVNYLSCIEGKGCGKDIQCSAQNAALFVPLLYNIF